MSGRTQRHNFEYHSSNALKAGISSLTLSCLNWGVLMLSAWLGISVVIEKDRLTSSLDLCAGRGRKVRGADPRGMQARQTTTTETKTGPGRSGGIMQTIMI
jgi:hypothetical protein